MTTDRSNDIAGAQSATRQPASVVLMSMSGFGRPLAVVGAGLAVAAALTGVALLGGGSSDRAGNPDGPPSRRPPTSALSVVEMSPTPGYGTTATPGVPAEVWNAAQIDRLSAAFERHLRAAAPAGTTFLDTPVNLGATDPFRFAESTGPGSRYSESFVVAPDLRDEPGLGNVVLRVGKPIGPLGPDGRPWPTGYGIGQFQQCPGDGCDLRTGPHGEKIVAMPSFQDEGGKKIARIDVTTADGTGICVEVRNFSLFRSGSRAGLPITLDQMIQLAVDPDLVIRTT
ncbi:hypothetical protein ACFPIJ_37135 [Dactylosporangium cerinum]|uniref:Uncharacterized protein n=1 Tax=Dactylosporangium cerinum TaxID=1434730 RepID=A0ABV9W4G1_9ACTN